MLHDSDSAFTPNIRDLFGTSPASQKLAQFLVSLSANQGKRHVEPEVHIYSDVVYFNYYPLGLSLSYTPHDGYKPKRSDAMQDLDQELLSLSGIDVYNKIEAIQEGKKTYHAYPLLPLVLTLSPGEPNGAEPSALEVTSKITGKEFLECLGEPERKGGGGRAGGPGIWCEWSKHGIMVEFGGPEAKGPNAWETGKDAVWQCITLFQPKDI
ncbi:hypothetical protein OE88DRAFT_1650484 [Heliocybe sulcata]|uniref:Uncharacterized protein n=1 Tax=Heliocybe sulcata TaxID=5364 RepID=A0A5C3NJ91_9AGAM|nr:hypothetical protein OE88DRAFT_1650484 [Heliocybe sulcata]